MSNEVIDLLNALSDGTLTVDEVADRFRARTWPRRRNPAPGSYLDALTAELQDPDTYLPGSFDDVIAAYDQRKISGLRGSFGLGPGYLHWKPKPTDV